MGLTERYLDSLRQLLPPSQRNDIIRELSENIQAEIEDKESELERPLSEPEVQAILQQHGSPMVAASRYIQCDRSFAFGHQIIGPVLFPFYAKVLALNCSLTTLVVIILTAALNAPNFFSTLLVHLAIQFGIVTGIFALVQANAAKIPEFNPGQAMDSRKPVPRVSRLESIAEIVALAVILSWLMAISLNPSLKFGSPSDTFSFGVSWQQFYSALFVVGMIRILQCIVNLYRPDWVRFRSVVRIACGFIWLGVMAFSLKRSDWLIPANPGLVPSPEAQAIMGMANDLFFIVLATTTAISTAFALIELLRLLRGWRNPAPLGSKAESTSYSRD